MLKITRIFIYCLINVLNFCLFVALFFTNDKKRLPFDLSFHCYFFNLIYFLAIFIIEIRQEFCENYSIVLLPFLRNEVYKFIYVLNFYSFSIYYILVILGPDFKNFPEKILEIFCTIYLTAGQLVFISVEFFIANQNAT